MSQRTRQPTLLDRYRALTVAEPDLTRAAAARRLGVTPDVLRSQINRAPTRRHPAAVPSPAPGDERGWVRRALALHAADLTVAGDDELAARFHRLAGEAR